MARWHPKSCKVCGIRASADEPISATGLCIEHAVDRMEANNRQIAAHNGPFFDHWRRRVLASFGGVPLDEVRDRP